MAKFALQRWRERLGLSQRKLAAVIGISQPTLRSIELGAWVPGPDLVRTIRQVTGRLAPQFGVMEANDFQNAWEAAHPQTFDSALRTRIESKRKEIANGKETHGQKKRTRKSKDKAPAKAAGSAGIGDGR